MSFHGHELKTSSSIGVALFPDHGHTWHQLYKAADLSLYDAKHSGRNTFRWTGPAAREQDEMLQPSHHPTTVHRS
jgi:predicted signal transduction protein with EAL and GGDEF domain